MAKLTKTTFKSFIKKNEGNLFIKNKSDFNGMTDGIEINKDAQFAPVFHTKVNTQNNLGILFAWFVGGGRDYFEKYELDEQGYEGITVSNCCGCFIVATKQGA